MIIEEIDKDGQFKNACRLIQKKININKKHIETKKDEISIKKRDIEITLTEIKYLEEQLSSIDTKKWMETDFKNYIQAGDQFTMGWTHIMREIGSDDILIKRVHDDWEKEKNNINNSN